MHNVTKDLGREAAAHAARDPLTIDPLPSEAAFYGRYEWSLNARPRVADVVDYLARELRVIDEGDEAWQRVEVRTNVFLLSCAITDALDDYVLGTQYDFSQATAVLPLLGRGVRAVEGVMRLSQRARRRRLCAVRNWRAQWKPRINEYLRVFEAMERFEGAPFAAVAAPLAERLAVPLPEEVRARRMRIPAAFRTQDLTHGDLFQLAQQFADAHPDRNRPVLVVGLRTAGSYFAPLVRAWLANAGYTQADWVTFRPTRDLGEDERAVMAELARRGAVAVIVDEAPNTGGTLAKAVAAVRKMGFPEHDVTLLVPIHATRPDWASGPEVVALSGTQTFTLPPADWRKHRWLTAEQAQGRIAEYFLARGYRRANVVMSPEAQSFNRQLRRSSDEKFHTRVKQVFEVRLRDHADVTHTRFVIGKSVGWGWLGYHAYIAAARLTPFVPPVLGLRDGILYSEWLPSPQPCGGHDRDRTIAVLASYTAARTARLPLGSDPSQDVERGDQHKGMTVLAAALSKASGWKPAAILQRARIRHALAQMPRPHAVLIDGKMRPHEWILSRRALLKTDFEHHGLGKTELNVTDPAYDLAEAILYFRLTPAEERALIERYAAASGDSQLHARLFIHKLLAGTWARASAVDNLSDPRLLHRHAECHEQYLDAGNFLTVHTTQHCASLCHRPDAVRWDKRLVVLDIDGVLDKQIFGYPSTTAAGIHAVSLLHAHGVPVAVNTARSLTQVQEYCDAYGFVGGVAEYGGVVWDAVERRERRLVGHESLEQLERLRSALKDLPGVFLDDAYRCGLRAYTFERGVTVPLPTLMIRNLLARLDTGRLTFHQTFVDTTVIPREIDKGHGLRSLLALGRQPEAQAIAIGDSEADLAMFRAASAAFAPSHISCRAAARLLGCRIMDRPFQPGLLQAVRAILHPAGSTCAQCAVVDPARLPDRTLFGELLAAADQPQWRLMIKALLDPMSLQTFAKH
jgi:hydroxymethylpyrimidine pyrophosphatase-like HAD family hydrolase